MRVGSGVAAQVEGAWPYAPVLEALADLCRRHPALLDGLDDALREEIESGLSGRERDWPAQSGDQRLFVAAAELVRLAAAGAGAVLVVDDAHEADDASLRLLHYLARSTVSERVLIVLAHRPQLCPALAQVRQSLLGRGHRASPWTCSRCPTTTSRALVRTSRPEADDGARRHRVGRLGGAAVLGGGTGPLSGGRARHWSPASLMPPSRLATSSGRWPRRPSSARPSTPTSSSR